MSTVQHAQRNSKHSSKLSKISIHSRFDEEKTKITNIKKNFLKKSTIFGNIVKTQNFMRIANLYQTKEVFSNECELENLITSMEFPVDFTKHEKQSKTISLLFKDIFTQARTAEQRNKLKLGETINLQPFCEAFFERNEFELYKNILKTFLLKICLFSIDSECSAVNCGDCLEIIHRMSEDLTSSLSSYKKKFITILYEYFFYMTKLLATLFPMVLKIEELRLDSGNIVKIHPAKIQVFKLYTYLIRNGEVIGKNICNQLNETILDIFFTWFLDNLYNLFNCIGQTTSTLVFISSLWGYFSQMPLQRL